MTGPLQTSGVSGKGKGNVKEERTGVIRRKGRGRKKEQREEWRRKEEE